MERSLGIRTIVLLPRMLSIVTSRDDGMSKEHPVPPKDFKNSVFKEHLSEPVGAVYADDQYWDNVQLEPPPGCKRIVVNLIYQSVSWEYLKFLVEENRTDNWVKTFVRSVE